MFFPCKKFVSLILINFLFLLCFSPISAISINITGYPSSCTSGDSFSVNLSVKGLDSNKIYSIKSGALENNCDVTTFSPIVNNWLSCTGSWIDMPKITPMAEEQLVVIQGKFDLNITPTPKNYSYYVRLEEKTTDSSKIYITSVPVAIAVIPPTLTPTITESPTPTLTPTQAPDTPTPTKTPTPSKIPTPSHSPTPSKAPTPSKTPTPLKSPTPSKKLALSQAKKLGSSISPTKNPSEKVLGAENNKTIETSSGSGQSDELVKILILIGVLFGISSVGVFFYDKYRKPIDAFYRRKFKNE